MDPFYVKTKDQEHIKQVFDEWGICIFPPGIFDISEMRSEALNIMVNVENENNGSYAAGYATKVFTNSSLDRQITNYPEICHFFDEPLFQSLFDSVTCGAGTFCEDVYMTKEIYSDERLARNGYLHFDRNWGFKILVYLSDVEEGCGPFSVVPKTHLLGKSLRQLGWDKHKNFEMIPNRADIDFPDVSHLLGNVQPIYGKAGTVVIFDTDILHLGGVVELGKKRWIIRSHSRSW
jgi:hypothetical protein